MLAFAHRSAMLLRQAMLGLICLLGLAQQAASQGKTSALGQLHWLSFQQDGSQFTINTSGKARLRINFLKDDIVRIWLEPQGEFVRDPSVSVVPQTPGPVQVTVEEQAGYTDFVSERLRVRLQKNPLLLSFLTADGSHVITGEAASHGMTWQDEPQMLSMTNFIAPHEHFYGLGEDNDAALGRMDRLGSRRDMWTGQEIRRGHVTADIPVNFFMSTGSAGGGYGIFFDNSYRTNFDMGRSDSKTYSWQAAGGEIDFYFIYGPRFPDILDRFTFLTGRPSMVPLWALGFIQSKCTYWDWTEIDDVVSNLRTRHIPMDVMVIDYDWARVPMDFQWADRWKGQSPQKIRDYEKSGTRFLISNAGPMLRRDASNYQDAWEQKLLATDGKGNPVTGGHYGGDIMDFTAPGMKDWLWPQLHPLYEDGIDGWWLDLTEPEGEPAQTVYHGGPRAKVHNTFALLNSKAYFEMQLAHNPDDRVFILTRTGFAGIQRYASAIWTGDIYSDYATLSAHVPEALNTGLSGIPYWTHDSGGFLQGLYKDNIKDHGRLYERWLQFAAYSAITRAHHVGPSAPYMFGESVEAGAKKVLQDRYRLLPYIYSYSWEAHQTGAPLMRPLVFAFQDDEQVFDIKDEYLFGDKLLVAPVLAENITQRKVYFPKGTWLDREDGSSFEGPTTACVEAPQSKIPVFARAGAIIPKAPLMQFTGEKPWDPLTIEVYPEGQSEFLLYQDDGESREFETQGRYTETKILSELEPGQFLELSIVESNKEFTPSTYQFEIHLSSRPIAVRYQGRELSRMAIPQRLQAQDLGSWTWDQARRLLFVTVPSDGSTEHILSVALDRNLFAPIRKYRSLASCPSNVPETPIETEPTGQIPHFFPPPTLPGKIQAENYDKGGEGLAYHDSDKGNLGGVYRADDVDLDESDDTGGGYHIQKIDEGEWYEYTLSVPKTGYYDLTLRTQSGPTEGRLHLENKGFAISDSISIPPTTIGWREIKQGGIYLVEGEQIIRLSVERGGFLLNWFSFDFPKIAKTDMLPYPSCQNWSGGFGGGFPCGGPYLCKKQNSKWEQNAPPAHWCLIDETTAQQTSKRIGKKSFGITL